MRPVRLLLLSAAALLAGTAESGAQCCSPGNPVSGSGNCGIVTQGHVRALAYYRHSFSDTYYLGGEKADSIYQGTEANYEYLGHVLSWGALKRLTLEVELGYFLRKTQQNTFFGESRTHGFSTAVAGAKYLVLHTRNDWEVTAGAGVKIPLTMKQFSNDMGALPPDLQPSTGAFGAVSQLFAAKTLPHYGLKFILLNRYEYNGLNNEKYRFGEVLYSSLFVSKRFLKHWTGLLQVRNEYRTRDTDQDITIVNTGGWLTFASPQLGYSFPPGWNVALLADFPVYRKYNDMQLSPRYAASISITKEFASK